jgi:hypothetical protein
MTLSVGLNFLFQNGLNTLVEGIINSSDKFCADFSYEVLCYVEGLSTLS